MDINNLESKIDKETILVSSVIYILIYGIPKTDTSGKSARKRLIRELGKTIAEYREVDKKEYLILVTFSGKLITKIADNMKLSDEKDIKNASISPDKLLLYIKNKRPDIFNKLKVSEETMNKLEAVYSASNLGFRSLMYVNRLLKYIEEYLNSDIDKDKVYQDILDKYNK